MSLPAAIPAVHNPVSDQGDENGSEVAASNEVGRLRVLVCGSTVPSHLEDGSPRFVYDLAEALLKHADVSLLAPHLPGAERAGRLGNVPIERFRYFWPESWQRLTSSEGLGMRERFRASLLAKSQVPLFLWRESSAIRRIVKRDRIDVVNAHWLIPQGLAAARALKRLPSVQLVTHIHAGDVYLLRRLPFGRSIARSVVRRCTAVLASGSHVRDTLDDLLGFPSNALLQPMGVHTRQFARDMNAEGKHVPEAAQFPNGFLVTVGRLVEKKGTKYLIEAMPELLRSNPGLGLIVIGSGPEEASLREQISTLEIEHSVRLLGRLPHAEIVRYLHAARVAVVPSIIDSRGETEGMPTTVIEAMAAGTPVVGSRVDGIPDVIQHGKNGRLCEEKNPSDLAKQIRETLEETEDERQQKNKTLQIEKFDWAEVGRRYAEYLCTPQITKAEAKLQ
ncbi:glycosyltransferase [Stratiformator vulcanicus]|uniref:Glycogen synthase n=1 Tax=Stratiformator vulcanicus TaxID=2527980 RepID=A0A517QW14_9PLAN|nr:glycosyltransferase [Stratiformator vulcanicus]QDT35763.1 Glycogen synthase [Stratiformator vulcanicus]